MSAVADDVGGLLSSPSEIEVGESGALVTIGLGLGLVTMDAGALKIWSVERELDSDVF